MHWEGRCWNSRICGENLKTVTVMSSVLEANTVYQLILTPIPLCQNSIKKPQNPHKTSSILRPTLTNTKLTNTKTLYARQRVMTMHRKPNNFCLKLTG